MSGALLHPGETALGRSDSERRFLRVVTVCSLMVAFAAIIALGFLSMRSRDRIHMTHYDPFGEMIYVAEAEESDLWDERGVGYDVRKLIVGLRSVSTDPRTDYELVAEQYERLRGNAAEYVSTHFRREENAPATIRRFGRRSVELEVIKPVANDGDAQIWKATWVERLERVNPGLSGDSASKWEAHLTIRMEPGLVGEFDVRNPRGFFVDELNWVRMATINLEQEAGEENESQNDSNRALVGGGDSAAGIGDE